MTRLAKVSGIIAGMLAVSAASAADIPAPVYKSARPTAYTWQGCYAGAQGGWIKSQSDLQWRLDGAYVGFLGQTAVDAFAQRYAFNDSGFTIGGHLGCNYQSGNWVAGLEADLNWSSLESDIETRYPLLTAPGGQTFNPHTDRLSNRLDWYSTVRGRIGLAFDRVMVFATGGLAIAQIETTSETFNAAGLLTFTGSEDGVRAGWTIGGGAEFALASNWSLRAEYLYLDFGSFSFEGATTPPSVFFVTNEVEARFHVVRAGLSYRFGAAPVTARY